MQEEGSLPTAQPGLIVVRNALTPIRYLLCFLPCEEYTDLKKAYEAALAGRRQ